MNWRGSFNKCGTSGNFGARVYLIYNSADYAWIVDDMTKRYGDLSSIVAHGICPTEAEAMAAAEAKILEMELPASTGL